MVIFEATGWQIFDAVSHCKDIESRVAGGAWADVVWGNQDAIDRRLCGLGDSRDLTEWFARWKEGGSGHGFKGIGTDGPHCPGGISIPDDMPNAVQR